MGSKDGGVFVAISDRYIASHQPQLETDCEILWVKLETAGAKQTYIGAFYRPHENDNPSLENLNLSLDRLKNTNSNIYLAGDFNLPGIDWELGVTKFNSRSKGQHDFFLEILNDHNFCQIVKKPTRGPNILDLFLTNNPSLIINQSNIPGLGDSDHDIVLIETLLKPIKNNKTRVAKPQYNKTNWELFKLHMNNFSTSFLKMDHENMSVDDLWVTFKNELCTATTKFVPHKVFSSKKLPWITKYIILLIHRRGKLHIKIKRGKTDLSTKYKLLKSKIKREMRKAYWNYIDSIISYNPDHSPSEMRSVNKKFWSFISSRKKDNITIPPLKSLGKMFPDAVDKANIKFSVSVSFFICRPT